MTDYREEKELEDKKGRRLDEAMDALKLDEAGRQLVFATYIGLQNIFSLNDISIYWDTDNDEFEVQFEIVDTGCIVVRPNRPKG